MKYFLIYLLIINLYGFYTMYSDKKKAIKKAWRTPEAVIFTIAALGGSLGVWIGMYTFRHKTKHYRFVIGVPVILLIEAYLAMRFLPKFF